MESLPRYLPEFTLCVALLAAVLVDAVRRERGAVLAAWITIVGALAAAGLTITGSADPAPVRVFSGMAALSPFVDFFRVFLSLTAVAAAAFALPHVRPGGALFGRGAEFFPLLIATTLGGFLLAGATHLVMVLLALEIISIPSYVMAGLCADDRRGAEASVKYVIYGGFATGAMVFGFSLLYGMTGSLDLGTIGTALAGRPESPGLWIAVLLSLAGAGYKISMVPFHLWAPDVYEGSPTPAVAFFSIGPKAAGIALMVRLAFGLGGGGGSFPWPTLFAVLSALAMIVGNAAALVQKDTKRMLAYSGIAHAGYLLLGLAAFDQFGLQAMLLYLVVYGLANLGFFLVIDMVERSGRDSSIDSFRGLGWREPMVGALLAICLFSLTGLPPTAGFIGKVFVFGAVIQHGMWNLAALGLLTSVVSLFYYVRVLRALYLEGTAEERAPSPDGKRLGPVPLLAVFAVPVLVLGLWWGGLVDIAAHAARILGMG
ncbi:MAG: NADH-quinone oxidoreductase subunit N [Gemmatimonadota bacterium]|jgi:NADH-quinone oxidoreductase subunit N|nr:NADH-quinone oxidoreductase subunit N [Gemmatimonadota bacterium]MDP6802520.1 NADH-quinone oxidoreductase subunit N [Gemmatimonadota bacterium]MDP7031783.1 NADH-quinone oxidoreductase subunit N [Gemmatimonadota bacterium]